MKDIVVLVNEKDEAVGEMDKMEVHRLGLLHRAISVFIFNSKGEMLLQKRAADKYHGAGLWSNTCCSHPFPGEDTLDAASRRLNEEMGFVTELHPMLQFTYRAEVENGLVEHEFDHVFAGIHEGPVNYNTTEVDGFRFLSLEEIRKELEAKPETYTQWFRIVLPKVEAWWQEKF